MKKSQENAKKPQKNGKNPNRLTPRQRRFVEEYLVDLNATQAAIRAGYSAKSAPRIAVELLNKTQVKIAIKDAMAEREKRTQLSQDKVIRELAQIAFADIRTLLDWGPNGVKLKNSADLTDAQSAVVAEVSEGKDGVRLKTYSKVEALEKLGRHLGMFQGNGTGRPKKHQEILQRYLDGEVSLKDTALAFEMNNLPLPETIRILLGKEQPEPEDASKGEYCVVSDEEMEILIARKQAELNIQREGLPERRAEMNELHKRVQEKFAPGASTKDDGDGEGS